MEYLWKPVSLDILVCIIYHFSFVQSREHLDACCYVTEFTDAFQSADNTQDVDSSLLMYHL
jgi:hypothetical protein